MSTVEPGFELSVERYIDAPPETLWRCWNERLEEWWCPRPWRAKIVEMDLRPGGRSCMEMFGLDGEATGPMEGVFLEVVPNSLIVFTDAFRAGWIPQTPFIVGYFSFQAEGSGTRYRAGARHWDEAAMNRHKEMGFEQGWATVADQLAEIAEAM